MPPKHKPEKPAHRPAPEITPDSVPDKPEILPDDMRRRDDPDPPDSLPPRREEAALAPDGGADDHPIHDEPMEDLEPDDFETMIDDAGTAKLERHAGDEILDPRANREFSPGSSDPLDQTDRRPLRIPNP